MPSFDHPAPEAVSSLTDAQRPTGVWAASLLHAIARHEAAGRRRPALTEPKLDTWTRFRGRLSSGRPLDADQLNYAALDAEVLLALHERFNTLGAATTDAAGGN